jgi:hypothetical protein
MTDDIIKNIFTAATATANMNATAFLEEGKKRHDALQERHRNIQELVPQVTGALTEIIRKCKQIPPDAAIQLYEKDLTGLIQNLTRLIQTTSDEVQRYKGVVAATENLLKLYETVPASFDAELQKARDIQALQEEGKLGKSREVGKRPNKLKDVRNYTLPETGE